MEDRNHRYELTDFCRYHDNTMTPGEQHIFEKRMLEDPFLREACEGFGMLHEDGIAIASVTGKLSRLLPEAEVARPGSPGKPVWRYMVAAGLLLIAAFFSYLRFGANTDSIRLKEAYVTESAPAVEKHSGQSQPEGKKTTAVMKPSGETAEPGAAQPAVSMISKKRDAFPPVDTLSSGQAGGINGRGAEADTWQLPRETDRLASAGFRDGEVIVVSDRVIRGKQDSASTGNIVVIVKKKQAGDTIKPGRGGLPATERMSFEEYLKRATRNTIRYGESFEFKILRNGRLEDLTPEEEDSLQKEMMRRKEN